MLLKKGLWGYGWFLDPSTDPFAHFCCCLQYLVAPTLRNTSYKLYVLGTVAVWLRLVQLFSGPGPFLRRPPPFVDSSGRGFSALRLVRSVRSCATLAKRGFFLKTKVLCPAASSGDLVRPKNWSKSEVCQTSQNFESSQDGLAYRGKS